MQTDTPLIDALEFLPSVSGNVVFCMHMCIYIVASSALHLSFCAIV